MVPQPRLLVWRVPLQRVLVLTASPPCVLSYVAAMCAGPEGAMMPRPAAADAMAVYPCSECSVTLYGGPEAAVAVCPSPACVMFVCPGSGGVTSVCPGPDSAVAVCPARKVVTAVCCGSEGAMHIVVLRARQRVLVLQVSWCCAMVLRVPLRRVLALWVPPPCVLVLSVS